MAFPNKLRLVEMSPRDGLQNEPGAVIGTRIKTGLIDRLADCGLNLLRPRTFSTIICVRTALAVSTIATTRAITVVTAITSRFRSVATFTRTPSY